MLHVPRMIKMRRKKKSFAAVKNIVIIITEKYQVFFSHLLKIILPYSPEDLVI